MELTNRGARVEINNHLAEIRLPRHSLPTIINPKFDKSLFTLLIYFCILMWKLIDVHPVQILLENEACVFSIDLPSSPWSFSLILPFYVLMGLKCFMMACIPPVVGGHQCASDSKRSRSWRHRSAFVIFFPSDRTTPHL